jgi:hypothetical protein
LCGACGVHPSVWRAFEISRWRWRGSSAGSGRLSGASRRPPAEQGLDVVIKRERNFTEAEGGNNQDYFVVRRNSSTRLVRSQEKPPSGSGGRAKWP